MENRALNTQSAIHIKLLVLLSVFLFWFSHYVYMPTLPQYIKIKVSTLTQVGIVLSMYGIWQVVVRLPIGLITDRAGKRKPFIILGISFAGIGALVLGFSESFLVLAIGRSLVGISMSAWVLQVVFFGRLFEPSELIKASSILTLSTSLAKLAGTISTGYLNNLGGYLLAFQVASFGALLSVLFMIPVKETRIPYSGEGNFNLNLMLKNRKVIVVSLLAGINQFLNFGITFGFFPLVAQEFGASDIVKSHLLGFNIIFLISGNLLVTYFGKQKNSILLLLISYLFFSFSVTLIPQAGTIGILFILQAILGLAHGISYPVLISLCIGDIPEQNRSSVMGFHQSIYAVGMFLGPWICGMIADGLGLYQSFTIVGIGTFILSFSLLYFLRRSTRMSNM